jgi:hypothetical protein
MFDNDGLKHICKCGHDVDTHFVERLHNGMTLIGMCLGVGCNPTPDKWDVSEEEGFTRSSSFRELQTCRYYEESKTK